MRCPTFAAVERCATSFANRAPCAREIFLLENLAGPRPPAPRQERARVARETLELQRAPLPCVAYLRAHGESVLGIGRGRLDKRGKVHGAKSFVQRKVAIERSRDSDGRGPACGMKEKPAARRLSTVRREPERPLALSPKNSPFQCTSTMQSPPSSTSWARLC